MLPRWKGKLDFRLASKDEANHLKKLYEAGWGAGITIHEDQIKAMIDNFPQGQIVGTEKGKDAPVSMINIMLMVLRRGESFKGGYEEVTGGRTFSTSLKPLELLRILDGHGEDAIGIASCVSIATDPNFARTGYAYETLNYAIMFSFANRLIPAPYSAPRGFARARIRNPELRIADYLHMTKPIGMDYLSYVAKIAAISPRICHAFNGEAPLSRELFEKYQMMEADSVSEPIEATAFWRFMQEDGSDFIRKFGRSPTIEDICFFSGRVLLDPVIRMHVSNGARMLWNGGQMAGIFENSRPEDPTSLGYNIVLSYGYHEILGHSFMKSSDSNGKDRAADQRNDPENPAVR